MTLNLHTGDSGEKQEKRMPRIEHILPENVHSQLFFPCMGNQPEHGNRTRRNTLMTLSDNKSRLAPNNRYSPIAEGGR